MWWKLRDVHEGTLQAQGEGNNWKLFVSLIFRKVREEMRGGGKRGSSYKGDPWSTFNGLGEGSYVGEGIRAWALIWKNTVTEEG